MLNSPDAELTCYPYITPVWKWPNTQQRPAPHCDCREIRLKYFLVDTHNSITTSWIFCKKYVTVLLSVKFEIILIHGIFIKWGDLLQNVYFSFICCCTISIKKNLPYLQHVYQVSSSSFGMRLCPLNLKEVYSSDTDALLRLMRWWEGKLCPDSKLCFIPCNDFKLTCSTFFFVLYSDMQDPQNVLTIISTKTLIWYNPMFVLYFVYQVLVSKN